MLDSVRAIVMTGPRRPLVRSFDAPRPAPGGAALEMVRDAGRYVIVGQYTDTSDVMLNPHAHINRRHTEVLGCWGYEFTHLHRHSDDGASQRPPPLAGADRSGYAPKDASRPLEDMERLAVVKAVLRPA